MRNLVLFSALFVVSILAENVLLAQTPELHAPAMRERELILPDVPLGSMDGGVQLPQALTWDASIAKAGNNADGIHIRCFAQDGDVLYVAGDFRVFDTVPSNFIVQYNASTGRWSTLDGGLSNNVNALVVHNGKLYAGGAFYRAGSNNDTVGYIAMWDGSWHALEGGMNGSVHALAFVGDTLYAGGSFTGAGGVDASFLAYWDGTSWSEASGGVSYPVDALYATHDSLFVGGVFYYAGAQQTNQGLRVNGFAMLRHDEWQAFDNGFWTGAITIAGGKLWAGGGYFASPDNSQVVNCLAYWGGSAWVAVGPDGNVGTEATGSITELSTIGDTLIALGDFSSIAGVPAQGVAMFHNGQWSALGGGVYGEANAVASFHGKLYVGGSFTKAGSVATSGLATLSADGSWSAVGRMIGSYIGWQSALVRAIVTTDRYVFIGGNFNTIAGRVCNHVAAWDKQTKQWLTLGTGVDGSVTSLAVRGNSLIVGGIFNHAGSIAARHIAMCDISTKQWSPMGNGAYRTPGGIAVNGSDIYAPVFNELENNEWYDHVGRWNGTSWDVVGDGINAGYIDDLRWLGSSLYAAGSFTRSDNEVPLNHIAQLIGDNWASLNSGLDNEAYALAYSGGKVFVGGAFAEADGKTCRALASWDGTSWDPIGDTNFNDYIYALIPDGKGGVYAGGAFTRVAGVTRRHLVHWDGTKFSTVSSGVDNDVIAMSHDTDAVYAGGWFESASNNTVESLHFAALHGAGFSAVPLKTADAFNWNVYPIPMTTRGSVSVSLETPQQVDITLYNMLGESIQSIYRGRMPAGDHSSQFDVTALPSGAYTLRLTSGAHSESRPIVIRR